MRELYQFIAGSFGTPTLISSFLIKMPFSHVQSIHYSYILIDTLSHISLTFCKPTISQGLSDILIIVCAVTLNDIHSIHSRQEIINEMLLKLQMKMKYQMCSEI